MVDWTFRRGKKKKKKKKTGTTDYYIVLFLGIALRAVTTACGIMQCVSFLLVV